MCKIKQAVCIKLIDLCKMVMIPNIATKCINKYEILNVDSKNILT